jgi:hypothetical protein
MDILQLLKDLICYYAEIHSGNTEINKLLTKRLNQNIY